MFKVRLSSHYINCKRDGHLNNRRWHVNAGWLFCPLYLLKSRNLLMTFLQENSLSTAKGGIWIKYCLQYKKKNGLLERENEAFGPLVVSTICGYSYTVLSIHLLSTVTEIPILNCTCSIISPLFAEWEKKTGKDWLASQLMVNAAVSSTWNQIQKGTSGGLVHCSDWERWITIKKRHRIRWLNWDLLCEDRNTVTRASTLKKRRQWEKLDVIRPRL